jgi:hypothetical protein
MLNPARYHLLLVVIALTLTLAGTAWADTLTLVTSPSSQGANDSLNWSQQGADGKVLAASFTGKTALGSTVTVGLAGANSVVSVVCAATPCSWTGTGFTAGHSLLWTSDALNGGNGPVTLTFAKGVSGLGAVVQADLPGAFTAKIQVFNGATSLGSFTVASSTGAATYIGVLDQTGPNITKAVFSLTTCATTCTDLAIDTVAIKAVVAAPKVQLVPASLAFASQDLHTTSAAKIVTLTNTGTATLNITSIAATGDYKETNTCGTAVLAAGKCTITVTFTPIATGTRTGKVSITDNATGSPQSVPLTGIGSEVKLSVTGISFPTVVLGTTSVRTATLTNLGTTTLAITSITVGGTNAADYSQTNTCGTSVLAGKSCTITVTFKPKAIGTRTASVSIADNGGGSPQSISLTGVGTQVKLSAATVAFPVTKVGVTSAAQTVTLTNVGTTTLSITGITLAGTNPGDFSQTNTCGSSVLATKACTITLKFKPTAIGARSANVSIADSGGGSPQTVHLTGTGN